ncbi:MAG: hypothetical protein WD403_02010, partial [Pirellulales bacterium]
MAQSPLAIRLFGHLLVRRQRRRKPPRRTNRVANAPEKCEERLPVTDVFFTTAAVSAGLQWAIHGEVAPQDLGYTAELSA